MHFTEGRRDLVQVEKFATFASEIKAVVFDIDGTLTDSISQIITCTKLAFSKYGLEVPQDKDIKGIIGKKLGEGLGSLLPEDKKNYTDEVTAAYRSIFAADKSINATILFPKVLDLLYLLKQNGFKVGFASGKSTVGIKRALSDTKLDLICDAYCAGDEVPSKPDKSMMLTVAKRLNLEPYELLGVGDAGMDIEMYKNAGSYSCAVQSGVWSGSAFCALNPDLLVPDVSFLIDLFKNLKVEDKSCGK